MIAETLLLFATAVVLVLFLVWRHRQRPCYLVTLQRVTNATQQPETVTVQANLPASASAADIWEAIEVQMGLPAQARMVSLNDEILEEVARASEEIKARQGRVKSAQERFHFDKKRRRIAKRLGKPVEQVTDAEVREALARAKVVSATGAQEAPG